MRISLLTCSKVKGPCSNWYKHLILKKKKNWQHANRSKIIWILCSSRLLVVSQIGFEKQHGTSCIYPFIINIEWILWKCRCLLWDTKVHMRHRRGRGRGGAKSFRKWSSGGNCGSTKFPAFNRKWFGIVHALPKTMQNPNSNKAGVWFVLE